MNIRVFETGLFEGPGTAVSETLRELKGMEHIFSDELITHAENIMISHFCISTYLRLILG